LRKITPQEPMLKTPTHWEKPKKFNKNHSIKKAKNKFHGMAPGNLPAK
jgi:hypothetical protein